MVAMVCEVISGAGVSKDDQSVAIKSAPGQQCIELLGRCAEQAGIHRVWPYGALMDTPHGDAKPVSGVLTKGARLIDGGIFKVNMDVVVGDDVCVFHEV